MSEEWKNRTGYVNARDMWFEYCKVEMTIENREQIRDVEGEFMEYWAETGHTVPVGRTLAQIYWGV